MVLKRLPMMQIVLAALVLAIMVSNDTQGAKRQDLVLSKPVFDLERIDMKAIQARSSEVEIRVGWDWSLPAYVKAEPYSGYFNFGSAPSKDINIIGNGPQALADITMAAGDYKTDNGTWTCGKGGQSPLPCSNGSPHIRISTCLVGGR